MGEGSDLSLAQAKVIGIQFLSEAGYEKDPVWVRDMNLALEDTYSSGMVMASDSAGAVNIASTGFKKHWPNSYNRVGSELQKKGYYFRAARADTVSSPSPSPSSASALPKNVEQPSGSGFVDETGWYWAGGKAARDAYVAGAGSSAVAEKKVEDAFKTPGGASVQGPLTAQQLTNIVMPFVAAIGQGRADKVAAKLQKYQERGGRIYIPQKPVTGGWTMAALFASVVVVGGVLLYTAFKR